jgi:CRP/FNR family cyclic AMP-dependent transcriptional regulator
MTVAATAAGADFWSALPPDDQVALRSAGATRRFARGGTLMHQGQVSDTVVVVEVGQVKVYAVTPAGRDVLLAIRGPGDLLGELSALDGAPRSASVAALQDVEVLAVSPAAFRSFLVAHPAAAMALLGMLTRRLRDADRKRTGYAVQTSLGRVAERLLELADRFGLEDGESVLIELRISQQELAGWCGCAQSAVDRSLATMRSLHWIETRRREIRVLDMAALRKSAV